MAFSMQVPFVQYVANKHERIKSRSTSENIRGHCWVEFALNLL